MQKSTKITIIAMVAAFLLGLIFAVGGIGRPAPADVEKAVLRDIQSYDDYQWVQKVEVIGYIKSFRERGTGGLDYTGTVHWSVKVCLIGDQQREERVVYLCGMFGQWEVSRWAIPIPP